jgi:hypothetical protein
MQDCITTLQRNARRTVSGIESLAISMSLLETAVTRQLGIEVPLLWVGGEVSAT